MYKDLLYCFFVLMPSFACLVGVAMLALKYRRGSMDAWLIAGGLSMAVSVMAEAAFILISDAPMFVAVIDVLYGLLSLVVGPAIYLWWRDAADERRARRALYLLFVLPLFMLFALLLFYRMLGADHIADFIGRVYSYPGIHPSNFQERYYLILSLIQYLLLILEAGLLFVYVIVDTYLHARVSPRNDYDKKLIRVGVCLIAVYLCYLCRISVSMFFMQQHPVVCAVTFTVTAAAIFLFFYYASNLVPEPAPVEQTPSVPTYASLQMKKDFDRLMDEERLYLQPGITIQNVADRLLTCRTYVVKMMANVEGEDFNDYITRRRIEYACECMLKERAITQEELAHRCGYADAAMFNKKFKAQTGKTPKTWLSEQP